MELDGKYIRIQGARQHNLRNVDVTIPRDRLVVITGLSGSGKSSLAFDTIYAEGQRKYVESLSAYARQFLEQMQKPDVERIEGLPPTIAIEQRTGTSSPRSTVATTTEIHDYLRVLFARVGQPHCWTCGKAIRAQSVTNIIDQILRLPLNSRLMILSPIIRGYKGEHKEVFKRIQREGFVRVRVDGDIFEVKSPPELNKRKKHHVEAVVDRVILKPEIRSRLSDSVELALGLSDGLMIVTYMTPDEGSEPVWQDQLFSTRYACPDHPDANLEELSPRLFSFNSPYGACPECDGLGTILEFDRDLIVPDLSLSLDQGAVDAWRRGGKRMNIAYSRLLKEFCETFQVSPHTPYQNLSPDIQRILLYGTTDEDSQKYQASFEGVVPNLQRRWESTDSEYVKARLHGYLSEQPCRMCKGARLRPEALAVLVGEKDSGRGGKSITDISTMSIEQALTFFEDLELTGERNVIAVQVLREIRQRLRFMVDVGIGYLTLNRTSATLSGGEAQRIRLATQVGSGLVGVCYVLDEPTMGLHPRDNAKLIGTLRRLADIGNTVLVVEHDEETIRSGDHIVDIGPGAGPHGGQVVAQGRIEEIVACPESLTGKYLSGELKIKLPRKRRKISPTNAIELRGARQNNLKDITVRFPLGVFCCVTGVSGSGKSTLVTETLLRALKRRLHNSGEKPGAFETIVGASRIDKVVEIDQSPIGRTPRSNPATYTGVFDLIRQLYSKTREAKIRGYKAGRFSFNVRGGRCEACQGQGLKKIEMHFLPDVYVVCDECKGTRYNRETLEIRYRGKNIADVLSMTVEEAIGFFDSFAKIKTLARTLADVGLSYIALGQSSTTLSGGEAQRVKLATELGKPAGGHTLYILDEPTSGLHFADIQNLLNVLNRLVDMGNSVLVIEHNLDVIKMADWIIDLGPEGGEDGGLIVAEGTPEEIAAHPDSYTGRYLQQYLEANHQRKIG
ncbi:MAG: excinuclease ABC subunit UvrA [Phycisphaerae bacterium]|nr:excinuclease ABC subunit UvrA [Phycisphaerae bacterium]